MDWEETYSRLPIPLQNVAVSLGGLRIQHRRFNSEFQALLDGYNDRALWPPEAVRAFRDQRISQFVVHAAQTVPYYRDLFRSLRIDPSTIRTLSDLSALPITTKAEVRADPARFTSSAIPRRTTTIAHTSGSTGSGLHFPATHSAVREQFAVWHRYFESHGIPRDTWCLYFGGRSIVPVRLHRPPFWRINYAGRQVMFSAYHLSPLTAEAYLRAMRHYRAPWIHGYPSFVSLIAHYSLQLGIRVPVRWVTLGAENLLPSQKSIIERAFGVTPRQHYGMAEAVANVSECPNGQLHVDEDFSAVEFVGVGPDVSTIIGTNFTNPAFPLLRYEVGDHVTVGSLDCSCGRPGRVIEAIDGRQEDYIVTRSGVRLGRLDHIFKDLVNVHEAQLCQAEAGFVTVRIVRSPHYTLRDERLLHAAVEKRLGADVAFVIEYLDQLERSSRGKLRFVESTVSGSNERRKTHAADLPAARPA